MQHIKSYRSLLLIAAVVLVLAILLALALGRGKDPEATPVDLFPGISYLESLEQSAPSVVEQTLKDQRQAELQAQRTEELEKLASGETPVWSYFQDYVMLGDSRAESFGFYEYLSTDRCLAEIGTTVSTTEDHLDQVKALNPSLVFLSFGTNDLTSGLWPTPEDYAAEYQALAEKIWNICPQAQIYINSIMPVLENAEDYDSLVDIIPAYNAALKEFCDATAGCYYVDNDAIAEDYPDLYEPDGIHFVSDFYPIWAANMIMEVLRSEPEDENPAA